MAINERALNRNRERRLYLVSAVLFAMIVVVGFGRTYYFKFFFDAPPLASILVHLHGIVMTSWVVLFAAQVLLIRTKNIRIHQKLGLASIALAISIVVIGFFTATAATRNPSAAAPPDIPPLSFLLVPLADLVMFSVFFAGAIYFRKRAANHKRLILLTALCVLPAAVARLPFPSLTALGPIFFFGLPALLTIIAVLVDRWLHGSFNRVFVAGALLLIVSFPVRLAISASETWVSIAGWLVGFSII